MIRLEYPWDHASHLPVLIGLGIGLPGLSRILELGGGLYSTSLFLNRDVFPGLKRLVTVETDPVWRENLYSNINGNPCWEIAPVDDFGTDWDLIFLDNGPKDVRLNSIRKFKNHYYDLLVVHDTETPDYSSEIGWIGHRIEFCEFEPQTTVLARRQYASEVARGVRRVIAEVTDQVAPDVNDVASWIQIFRGAQ